MHGNLLSVLRQTPIDMCSGAISRAGRARIGWASTATVSCLALALTAVLAGCHRDARISVSELEELQQGRPAPVLEPSAPDELGLAELQPYRIVPGDVLTVRMFGLAEDHYAPTSIELRVHEDGNVLPPLVGPVKVAGLTLNQAEQAIIAAHVPRVVSDLSVFIQLTEPETTTVLVLGSVMTPGLVRLRENERNILYALAASGGFGSRTSVTGGGRETNEGLVRLHPIRPGRASDSYNLGDPNDVHRAMLAPPLDSGDILVVEATEASAIFVTGLVTAPGPVPIPPSSSLSVLRAIAAAGGLREYVQFHEATLIRALPGGEDAHMKLDLAGMLAGRTPDLPLRGGDILYVPGNLDTFLQEWFLRNMIPGPFNVSLHYDPLAQYNANRALQDQYNNDVIQGIRSTLGSTIPGAFIPPVPAP